VSRPRTPLVLAGALAVVSAAVVVLALAHGLAALHRGERAALRTDRQTAAIDVQVAIGREAMAHLGAERSSAALPARALPAAVDDHSILASVVAAATASGTTLSDEQRGQPATAGAAGLVRVPVTLDVNASALGSLVRFADDLQHQSRLFSVSALEFTTAGGASLHASASVFIAPLLAPPGSGPRAP